MTHPPPRLAAGTIRQVNAVDSGLCRLAQRVRTFSEGCLEASPPPALLTELTDALLTVAATAVETVADEPEPLSRNAMLRLLAWTVADARGAVKIMTKADALVVGKRLFKQAGKVRDDMQLASSTAAQERCDLAGRSPALSRRQLAEEHAQINAKEQRTFDNADTEVYVGFSELIELLQPPELLSPPEPHPPPEQLPPPEPLQPPKPECGKPAVPTPGVRYAPGVRYPWLVPNPEPEDTEEVPAVPPDLSAAVTSDVLQRLNSDYFRRLVGGGGNAEDWWSACLPSLACDLARQVAEAQDSLLRAGDTLSRVEKYRLEDDAHNTRKIAEVSSTTPTVRRPATRPTKRPPPAPTVRPLTFRRLAGRPPTARPPPPAYRLRTTRADARVP